MKRGNGIATRLVAGMMALALVAANVGQAFQTQGSSAGEIVAADVAPSGGQGADAITGAGPWLAKAACIACGGALIAFGGTTVVGVVALMIAGLPITVACLDYCATGFGWFS